MFGETMDLEGLLLQDIPADMLEQALMQLE
jgi:hypothetical protein